MIQSVELVLLPEQAADRTIQLTEAARLLTISPERIKDIQIKKRSIDARGKAVKIRLMAEVFVDQLPTPVSESNYVFDRDVSHGKRVIIVGLGPAGMFAALRLIEKGMKPVIIERGKKVRDRRRDLANISKEGIVNPDSNYCFGEGGAGTYSDGKLYTRSNKRGNIHRILDILIQHGADPNIRVNAHPHIGTNKLPGIVEAIRETILNAGGEIHFNTRLIDIISLNDTFKAVVTEDVLTGNTERLEGEALILATGHSARDIYELFARKQWMIEAKPFALGVRIEHPQEIIDKVQYHCEVRGDFLPPASYSLTHQYKGRGVYSFCMCPGGIIAPAATSPGEIVVNGWSPSKRNNPFANSGMVVGVNEEDFQSFKKEKELSALRFQQSVEQNAFHFGGGNLKAPAQRMVDFVNSKVSMSLPDCSYHPGVTSVDLQKVLPKIVSEGLKDAFRHFAKKMKPYFTNEAILVATESRTSSPVRIPRDNNHLQHPQIKNLYPCGEGAGYAGGIVSAAMDGERCAEAIN